MFGVNRGIPFKIRIDHRLLKPENSKILHLADQLDRTGDIHSLIGVHHDLQVGADGLADQVQPADVTLHVRAANLDLDCGKAALFVIDDLVYQLLVGVADPAAAAIDRDRPAVTPDIR